MNISVSLLCSPFGLLEGAWEVLWPRRWLHHVMCSLLPALEEVLLQQPISLQRTKIQSGAWTSPVTEQDRSAAGCGVG